LLSLVYAIKRKFIGQLGNSTLNFTRKTDIATDVGFTREIQRGFPSSTNEFTYNIPIGYSYLDFDFLLRFYCDSLFGPQGASLQHKLFLAQI
jgi:hypothetical protein